MVRRTSTSELGSQADDKKPAKPRREDEEPTFIPTESLTCPILAKISVAFEYAAKATHAEKDGDLCPGSKAITGILWLSLDVNLAIHFIVWSYSSQVKQRFSINYECVLMLPGLTLCPCFH